MSNLSKEDYLSYLRSQMRRWDYQNGLDTARHEGVQIGEENAQIRIARRLKEQGVLPEIIAGATGLEVGAVERL